MNRYYDVSIVIGEKIGFVLTCYENDKCIWEGFFKNSDKAEQIGQKFLDGTFIEGFNYSD